MKFTKVLALALVAALGLLAQAPAPPKTHLKVGDVAPDFTLPSTQGKPVKLSDFRGKKNVVLAFYPAAFTGGCTKEMTAYGSDLAKFETADTQVFGVSTDNSPSQKKFAESVNATFPMLSDFNKREVSKDYGVLMADRGIANRATFVIDKEGKIQHIEEGSAAVDISGAMTACSRLAHK
ncbi:MAG: peroxiredoxin [Bryobacteraceae bacterium]